MGSRRAPAAILTAARLVRVCLLRVCLVRACLIGACLIGATACGSTTAATFRPAGKIATGAPAEAQESGPRLQKFPLPASLQVEFDTPLPADQAQAAIMVADENYQLAFYYSLSTGGKDRSYTEYASAIPQIGNESLAQFTQQDIAHYATEHVSRSGTIRFFDARIVLDKGAGAEVQYCVDESQFNSVNTQTGSTTPLKNPYYLEQDSLVRESDGSWLVTYTYGYYPPNQQAEACVS
jgi:hypothetical protein